MILVNEMDCIFCKIINGDIPSYTLYENDYVKCFLDVNPLSDGHTLIVPKKHFKDLYDIDIETLNEIFKASKIVCELINKKLNSNGIRIVQNNGVLQEVKHYHMHVLPNYAENNNKTLDEIFNLLTK